MLLSAAWCWRLPGECTGDVASYQLTSPPIRHWFNLPTFYSRPIHLLGRGGIFHLIFSRIYGVGDDSDDGGDDGDGGEDMASSY